MPTDPPADTPAQAAARAWLHSYGIGTMNFRKDGLDHPAMFTLPKAFESFAMPFRDVQTGIVGKLAYWDTLSSDVVSIAPIDFNKADFTIKVIERRAVIVGRNTGTPASITVLLLTVVDPNCEPHMDGYFIQLMDGQWRMKPTESPVKGALGG